jgi:hypothetical protein
MVHLLLYNFLWSGLRLTIDWIDEVAKEIHGLNLLRWYLKYSYEYYFWNYSAIYETYTTSHGSFPHIGDVPHKKQAKIVMGSIFTELLLIQLSQREEN